MKHDRSLDNFVVGVHLMDEQNNNQLINLLKKGNNMTKAICINPYGSDEEHPDVGYNTTKGEVYEVETAIPNDDEQYFHVYRDGVFIESSNASRWKILDNSQASLV